jgi:epoxyqueuosine reductase QueG
MARQQDATPPAADPALFAELRNRLLDRGASVVACGDLTVLPAGQRQGMPVGVCIGVALDARVVAGISRGPTPEYAAEYGRVNALLDGLADEAAAFLRERGFRARASGATVTVLDEKTLATQLPHKTVATRAGVGWIGKCALLISRQFGSAVRYNTVLTDAPLPVGTPVEVAECGDCVACVEACPAGAPSGKPWRVGDRREDRFDAFACCEAVRQLCRAQGIDEVICGICIAACPHTGRYLAGHGDATTVPPVESTEETEPHE